MPDLNAARGAQPLPLIDAPAGGAKPALERDHEDATWYRLLTTLASCYTYVTGHTDVEPVRFTLSPDGTGACYVGAARRWVVELTPAAHRALPVVAELWRAGALNQSDQTLAVALAEPVRLPDGSWSLDLLPAVAPDARTRTVARR